MRWARRNGNFMSPYRDRICGLEVPIMFPKFWMRLSSRSLPLYDWLAILLKCNEWRPVERIDAYCEPVQYAPNRRHVFETVHTTRVGNSGHVLVDVESGKLIALRLFPEQEKLKLVFFDTEIGLSTATLSSWMHQRIDRGRPTSRIALPIKLAIPLPISTDWATIFASSVQHASSQSPTQFLV